MKLKLAVLLVCWSLVGQCISADPQCVDEYGNPISRGPFEKEDECTKFHTCTNGQLIINDCPEGLAFDPLIGVCNDAKQVYGCEHVAGVDPSLSGYCRYENGSIKVPPPPPTRIPGTCDSYYYCENGNMREQPCPPGLVFNPDAEICDLESDSPHCEPGTTLPPSETTTTVLSTRDPSSSTSTVPTTTTKTEETTFTTVATSSFPSNTSPSSSSQSTPTAIVTPSTALPPHSTTTTTQPAHPECVDEYGNPISRGPFAKENDCTKFHTCTNGQLIINDCPEGLAFDPSIGVCQNAMEVYGCEHIAGVDPSLSGYCRYENGSLKIPSPPPTRVPGTCDSYYTCENGNMREQTCSPGLVFNPDAGMCDWDYNSPHCEPGTTLPPFETTTGILSTRDPSSSASTSSPTVPTTTTNPPGTTVTTLPTSNSPSTTKTPPSSSSSSSQSTSTVIVTPSTTLPPHSTTTTTTTQPAPLTYLGFVVDDTGSMYNEIEGVKEWIINCVYGKYEGCKVLPTGGWLMTSFNDPLYENGAIVGPTTDVEVIINAIDTLIAHGGGDCPEYSLTGLESAIAAVPHGAGACKMYFFTDALAKDEIKANSVMEQFQNKGCSFVPYLTSCCGTCEEPPENYSAVDGREDFATKKSSKRTSGESVYYMMANNTGGTIFLTDKPSSPDEMLEFLEEEVTLGFCPTTLIAGPPPNGYSNEHDCNKTHSCWDRSMGKCYCMSETEPCPKDPIDVNCPKDEELSHFPDVTDCKKFYQCSYGRIWLKDCAEGTVFDPTIGVCNHPYLTPPPCGTYEE